MWLIIRKLDSAVVGTAYARPVADAWDIKLDVKEWAGPEPPLHDPDEGILSYDPTLGDSDYPAFLQGRSKFEELEDQAEDEIAWLESTIAIIDTMTAVEVRGVVKRLAQENLRQIRAWRYVFRRFG